MADVRDPIAVELFKNAIFSLADEMAVTIFRTSYSAVLKGAMDYSTALCDADGDLVAQGLTIPMHLGAVPTALAAVLRHYGDEIQPGDVYILNDPFDGGMHLPDIFMFEPIYAGGERVAFAATVCHHTDVGGRVAGSNAADSTETYQEGLRIPPLKFYEAGVRNETIAKFIEKNVRVPIKVFGDIRAQLAACYTAKVGVLDLVEQFGLKNTKLYFKEVIRYAERLARAAIGELPDGVYDFEDWVDDDGVDFGQPIHLQVTFRKEGETLHADWTGSAPQVKGALNSTLSCTKAVVYCAVKCVLPGNIPSNEGLFRTVSVTAEPGTVVNPVLPASTAARALTTFRMLDCCFGALAKALPDRVFAASDGGNVGVAVGGYHADFSPFVYVDFGSSAWGGRPTADGVSGNANMHSNNSTSSVEMMEAEHPLEMLAYEYVQDGGGPGRFRGGLPYRRDYRLTEREAVMQIRNDRRAFLPYGLFGGKPGAPSVNRFNPATDDELMTSKVTQNICEGDMFRYQTAGGGGWGDPLERETWRVLADTRNEYVSVEAAREHYGVIIDAETWTVDEAETAKRRYKILKERGSSEPPFVDRGPLPDGIQPR